ncbi:DM13 domain-containing protein [Algicella marina]|uniref:Twin-arginine translocation pathway signal protein n=1 Tax=Algicella marina TaxID=2683284 RepID=A0A6P1T4A2_9RHOB|nr:DM13 domain-containing protein [Algicella marina]QHQ36585.1 twin-arginine translocation pathway signal protein [Algicella marina]
MLSRRTTLLAIAASPLLANVGFAASTIRSGTFTGKSRHEASGTASLVEESGSFTVQLGADFSFDGAPDPKIALGRNGYDPATLLAPLASDSGAQTYAVPAAIDAASYNEIWIWCERFNVPLGLAILK